MAFTQQDVSSWFAANPGATEAQVAETVRGLGGLDAHPGLAGMIGQHYNTDAANVQKAYTTQNNNAFQNYANSNVGATDVQLAQQMQNFSVTPQQAATTMNWNPAETETRYAAATPFANMANMYGKGDYSGINSLLAQNKYTNDQIANTYGLNQQQLDEIRGKGVNLGYTTPEIKSYVSGVLGDQTLSPFDKINKVLETGQAKGVNQDQLESIYGKSAVQPYMDTYKKGINDFLAETLAKDTGTTMNEVGAINKAAKDYNLSVDEIAKYGGMDTKTAQSYFDMYNAGLGSIVTGLLDPKTDDVTKTKTALALSQQYGTTDAELAKASNGKLTEKQVAAYLDPVRNTPAGLQKLMDDPNASAADIAKFINDAKADTRVAGIYGVALDKVLASPEFVMRDIKNGTGSLAENYQTFLNKAKSTPENATKYADAIAAVEKMLDTTKFTANENFGGKPQDYQLQIVSALPAKATEKVPKQLEMTPIKTETRDDGEGGTYQVQTGGGVKTKGVSPIGGGSDAEGGVIPVTGYKATEPVTVNGLPVYAEYDVNGKLTGYMADSKYASWQNGKQYISGAFDANGKPKPIGHQSSGAGIRGFTQDIMSDPILGSVANIAASYFGGPLGVATLAAVQGVPPEEILKRAVISMAANEVGGRVSGGTGDVLGKFGSETAGQLAGNATAGILSGQSVDLENMLLNSLLNTGMNTGINSLLGSVDLNTLGAAQPYATGIGSTLLANTLTGKDTDLLKTVAGIAQKEATKTGKEQFKDILKTAKAP